VSTPGFILKSVIMKNVFVFFLVLLSLNSMAQGPGSFSSLSSKTIRLNGTVVNGISDDSALINQSHVSIPTEWAVWNFFQNRLPYLTVVTGKTYVVGSQSAMLALSDVVGNVAVRTDSSKSYILQALPASTLANWVQLLFPAAVNSVYGRTGAISALASDYNSFYQGIIPNLGDTIKYLKKGDTATMLNPYTIGTGTVNYIPLFSGTKNIGNSNLYQDGTSFGFGTNTPHGGAGNQGK